MKASINAILLTLALAGLAYGQEGKIEISSLDRFGDTAQDVIEVTVDENLIQMAAKFLRMDKPDEARIRSLIENLKGVFVKRFVFEKEGEYSTADVEAIRSQLNAPGWSRIANVRSKRKGNFDVVIMTQGSVIKGLAVLAAEPRALTVVNIVGPIDVEKLSQLQGRFGIPRFDLEQGGQAEEKPPMEK
ncbi:MAG TPA: DUF4252 domain-containing protein [Blastocatellia bacterium]|nr:DUF4252 domain-containing protein [Blastocatellia bacterium]